jgi:uncharacterized protein YndB with AHSA1/START domain
MIDVVEVTVHIRADRAVVFSYFIDPERYVEWMGHDATIEPVPGGTYRVRMREGIEALGEFVSVDPPRRLEFTWGWRNDDEVPPGSSRVVVTLTEEDGGTRVVLRHHDLPTDRQRDHHKEGWTLYLERLVSHCSGAGRGY